MNVLFHVGYPLAWAPGGHAMQIRATQKALEQAGVSVAWLHPEEGILPPADLIHYWGLPPSLQHLQLARRQGVRVVCSAMVALAANRSPAAQAGAALFRRMLSCTLGARYRRFVPQSLYAECDHVVLLSSVERDYLTKVWGVPPEKTSIIPNGVDEAFWDETVEPDLFDGLLYAGFICDVKNSVELAMSAKTAQVPIRFVGGVRVEGDDYVQQFRSLVDGKMVQWVEQVVTPREMAAYFKGAKGIVLASKYEGYPLVALEAFACGKPLLLPNLPNLRALFGASAEYAPPPHTPEFASCLREFWKRACEGRPPPPFPVPSWTDVAGQLQAAYRKVLPL